MERIVSPGRRRDPEPRAGGVEDGRCRPPRRPTSSDDGAVVESGTGTAAQIPGISVAGKTGTAETGVAGRNDTWFIAFAPVDARRSRSPSRSRTRPAPAARRRRRSPGPSSRRPCERNPNLRFPMARVSDTLINTLFDGRYRILRKLGSGRDGERLPRRGRGARTPRGDQDPERALRERRALHRAFPARGEVGRRALPPEHRLDLRPRRGRGHVLHRHGGDRGAKPQGADPDPRSAPGRTLRRLREAAAGGAPLRPPARDHPPRHQAAQRARLGRTARQGERAAAQGDRLRHRAPRRLPDDRSRVDHGHRAVPLARAGPRGARDGGLRPVLGRGRALRDAHREGAVHGRLRDRDRHEARERGSEAAFPAAARDPPRARQDRPPRARQGAGGPLPDGGGLHRGPRAGRGGPADLARHGDGRHGDPRGRGRGRAEATELLSGDARRAWSRRRRRPDAAAPADYPPASYEERPKRRRWLPWLLVAAPVAAAAFAGWCVYNQIQEQLEDNEPVGVPLVEGLDARSRQSQRIEGAGLEAEVERQRAASAHAGSSSTRARARARRSRRATR